MGLNAAQPSEVCVAACTNGVLHTICAIVLSLYLTCFVLSLGVDHGIMLVGNTVGPGLHITHNEFNGGSVHLVADSTKPVVVQGVRVEDNYFGSVPKASRVTKQLTQTSATSWCVLKRLRRLSRATLSVLSLSPLFDCWLCRQFSFCDVLAFPTIAIVKASLQAASGFANVVTRPPVGCKVTVETDKAITGTMTVSVDASELSANFL